MKSQNTLLWINRVLILIDGPKPTAEERGEAMRKHKQLIDEQMASERLPEQQQEQEDLPL